MKVKSLGRVRFLATPWTAAHHALPSMGFSRQEYWSGVPAYSKTQTKVALFFFWKFWKILDNIKKQENVHDYALSVALSVHILAGLLNPANLFSPNF